MSEEVISYRDLVIFSTHAGPDGRPMAQITLPDAFASIPVDQMDRLCIGWINHRARAAIRSATPPAR